jgi:hypothetical protein
MQTKMTYYFTYEIRGSETPELKRGGFVFKSTSIHPENLARRVLWPEALKLEPQLGNVKYRSHEIHEWPNEDIIYQAIELEDQDNDF